MIPFGNKKKIVTAIVHQFGKEEPESQEESHEEGLHDESLHAISEELVKAIHEGDAKAVMHALKAFLVEHEAYGDKDELED